MIIYLDFDGTVVEHQFPIIGMENKGWKEVYDRLIKSGHEIHLNTMRSVLGQDDFMAEALIWFRQRGVIFEHTQIMQQKKHPEPWGIDVKNRSYLMLDDMCPGIPLKEAVCSPGRMVDWERVDKELETAGIYDKAKKKEEKTLRPVDKLQKYYLDTIRKESIETSSKMAVITTTKIAIEFNKWYHSKDCQDIIHDFQIVGEPCDDESLFQYFINNYYQYKV